MVNKQKAKSGDNSTVNQANGDISIVNNVSGLSYTDAKDISMEVFESNFYRLSDRASEVAVKRAEELIDSLFKKIKKLEKSSPHLIEKIEIPDVQYAVITAQRQYARSGNQSVLKILSELLQKRFQSNEESLKSIVLNEAIEVISKLTTRQISIVATIFLVKNCQVNNAYALIQHLQKIMPHPLNESGEDISFYEHLMYTGAITNDLTVLAHQKLEYLMSKYYSEEFIEYIDSNVLSEIERHARMKYITDRESKRTFDNWNKSLIQGYSLTSVGKAIAVAHLNSLYNFNLDLKKWIRD